MLRKIGPGSARLRLAGDVAGLTLRDAMLCMAPQDEGCVCPLTLSRRIASAGNLARPSSGASRHLLPAREGPRGMTALFRRLCSVRVAAGGAAQAEYVS